MNYQNEQRRLTEKWTTSTVVLSNKLKEITMGEVVQTNRFANAALDIVVMKLLEVQKGNFTKESYDILQHAILKAIDTKSMEVAQVFDDLIHAMGNLQNRNKEQQHKINGILNQQRAQDAMSVLQKTLQAIIFNVSQMPYEQMTHQSVEQVNQSLQAAKQMSNENATLDELTFAFTAILKSLLDIQLQKGNFENGKPSYNA